MSNRSPRFRKLKQALRPTPPTHAASKDTQRPLRVVPADGHMPVRPRPLAGGHAETQLMPVVRDSDAEAFLTRELPKVSPSAVLPMYPHTPYSPISGHPAPALDVTQVLPVVKAPQPTEDTAATQSLPAAVALPPSARHVDPKAMWSRLHVEDNDLEPETRGRHVLDELKAEPDVATLVAVQQRAHTALDAYDPMRRAEVAARANDERMRAFAAKWDTWENRFERDVESWCAAFKKDLAATRSAWAATSGRTNAARLEMDYRDGGTSAALYTKEQLAQEIARRDAASSAVAQ